MKPPFVFDLDGTLVDSLRGIADSLNRTLSAHGLPSHPDPQVRSFVGDGLRNLILRALPPAADLSLVESVLAHYRKDYEGTWQHSCHPYPGIHNMLTELERAGHPLAVLSNKVHAFTLDMVRGAFPDIEFQAILGQRDGIPHKPDPHGALEIAHRLSAAPAHCTLIGDSTVDFLTAKNAGMQAVSVDWGYHDRAALEAVGSSRIVSNAEELAGILLDLR
jgi:phosphoglycolate phosphatase